MKFSELCKTVKLEKLYDDVLYTNTNSKEGHYGCIGTISAQYNSDRFKYWIQVISTQEYPKLALFNSPHVHMLRYYDLFGKEPTMINRKQLNYYKLQQLYGRDDSWIIDKMKKFIHLFNNINKNGVKEPVQLLEKPLVENDFNSDVEIWEGHHRLACCDILEIPCPVTIYKWSL